MRESSTTVRAGSSRSALYRRAAAALALALAPLALASCADRDRPVRAEARATTPGVPGAVLPISTAELLADPRKYAGRLVRVTGEVNDVFAPRAFTIGGEEFHADGELPVIGRSDLPGIPERPQHSHLSENDLVQVTGTVHVLLNRKIEPSVLDFAFGDDPWIVEWEGKPVLLMSSMVTYPRAVLPPLRDVTRIVTHAYPLQFVGRRVELRPTPVRQVVSSGTLWVGRGPLLEIMVRQGESAGRQDVKRGQMVSVSGTLRKAPPIETAAREWGLNGVSEAALEKQGFYLDAESIQAVNE